MSCISLYLYYIEFSFNTDFSLFFLYFTLRTEERKRIFPPVLYNPANPVFKGFSTNYNSVPAEIFQPLAASKRLAGLLEKKIILKMNDKP